MRAIPFSVFVFSTICLNSFLLLKAFASPFETDLRKSRGLKESLLSVAASNDLTTDTKLLLEFEETNLDGFRRKRLQIFSNGRQLERKVDLPPTSVVYRDISSLLKRTFLPVGYPESVPHEYTEFQCYNLVQDLCSYLRGVMSTQAILEGMGVGRSDITALQATVNWIIRDGASMVGSLLFTSLFSSKFGNNVKSWRLFADFINNVGLTLYMIAPLLPSAFLPLICIASVCGALCGVAAGGSGAAISEHWGSKRGNIAEVLTKNSAQHTIVSLIGLGVSIPFAKIANASRRRLWLLYSALTVLHMYSNYKAMKVLALQSLNEYRLSLLVEAFIRNPQVTSYLNSYNSNAKNTNIRAFSDSFNETAFVDMKPSVVAVRDPIIYPLLPAAVKAFIASRDKSKMRICFYSTPSKDLCRYSPSEIHTAFQSFSQQSYIILSSLRDNILHIMFRTTVEAKDAVRAMLTAAIVRFYIENKFGTYQSLRLEDIFSLSNKILEDGKLGDTFYKILAKYEWDLNRLNLFPTDMKYIHMKS